jgi:hypothetical protein
MANERTPLAALLAEQPDERLAHMLGELREQIGQLQAEVAIVERALARRSRRGRSSSRRESGTGHAVKHGNGGHFTGIKREEVLATVRSHGAPVTPAEVRDLFLARDITTNTEAMRTALNRLVNAGHLTKLDDGQFALADSTMTRNGQLPVTEPLTGSQDLAARHES